jgi:ribosomal-protein-alanine N-acetyltransferase
MHSTRIRSYESGDRERVLELLRLNTPKYFSVDEEPGLVNYLANEIEEYFVLELDGIVVGCGGINFSDDGKHGVLSWDIFHPEFHRQGLGSHLVQYRIERLKANKDMKSIIVRTSQHTWKFYEQHGFELQYAEKDYWAKDFDLYAMEYQLNF